MLNVGLASSLAAGQETRFVQKTGFLKLQAFVLKNIGWLSGAGSV
jgi:hypothetical protein